MSSVPRTRVLVVARDLEIRRRVAHALESDGRMSFDMEEVPDARTARERLSEGAIDIALVRLQAPDGLDAVRDLKAAWPDVPLVALLATGGPAASEAAVNAGAVDSLAEERLDAEIVRRTIRFALEHARLQGEAHRQAVVDAATCVYNARGFEQLAAHHLRLAGRSNEPVVLVFVRIEMPLGVPSEAAPSLVRDTAEVLREAVRDADVVGRLGVDTFGVVLSGDASGNEGLVLSRIVEAVASRNANSGAERLALSIGSATSTSEHPLSAADLIRTADDSMRVVPPDAD
ncbi:MAG: GGDEF domain-containing protein [Actinomycetota bacterium]